MTNLNNLLTDANGESWTRELKTVLVNALFEKATRNDTHTTDDANFLQTTYYLIDQFEQEQLSTRMSTATHSPRNLEHFTPSSTATNELIEDIEQSQPHEINLVFLSQFKGKEIEVLTTKSELIKGEFVTHSPEKMIIKQPLEHVHLTWDKVDKAYYSKPKTTVQ